MTVASAATSQCKKAMEMGLSLFRRTFNSSKCKTMAKMTVARIKLLRNKREVVVRQMRRDIAMLLESRQDATARVRVEHVIREQNIMAANEFLELFCELIVARLPIIAKQKECPADLKEGISSLIFAAPRCSDIPELCGIRDVFEKKYGKDFVSAATDLRPNAGVNRTLIEKLSVRTPAGEVKLKVLKEIAKEYKVDWDTTESEMELLKPPEELIDGPSTFVSASTLPLKPYPKQSLQPDKLAGRGEKRHSDDSESSLMDFQDPKSAAEAAAESAKRAIAAAEVAAYLASKDREASSLNNPANDIIYRNGSGKLVSNGLTRSSQRTGGEFEVRATMKSCSLEKHPSSGEAFSADDVKAQRIYRRHSYNVPNAHSDINFDESDCDEEIEVEEPPSRNDRSNTADTRKAYRRHSYNNNSSANSGVKFDESDYAEMEEPVRGIKRPPNRPAPRVPSSYVKQNSMPRVHPKLPDYDSLAARFEALKYHKS